jgi:hypothetical protein
MTENTASESTAPAKASRDRGRMPKLRAGDQVTVPGGRVGEILAVYRYRDNDWRYDVQYVDETSRVETRYFELRDLTVLDGVAPDAEA